MVDDKENFLRRENCIENPIGCGILFKKDKEKIGLYDEKFKYHEDLDFRLRFEKHFKIDRLKIPLYRYRRHHTNITNNTIKMDIYKDRLNKKHNLFTNT